MEPQQGIGSEFPETYEGDPDGHPDEDWEVFYGRVQMLMLDENGDGYRVEQNMTSFPRFSLYNWTLP